MKDSQDKIIDIKDLSVIQKQKLIERQRFTSYFFQCVWGVIAAAFIIVLFGIFMVGDFKYAFTLQRATATSGIMVVTFILLLVLMLALYGLDAKNKKNVRNFWLTLLLVVITFALSITLSVEIKNYYVMPIAIVTLVIMQLIGTKAATLSTAVVGITILSSYAFSGNVGKEELVLVTTSVVCNSISPLIMTFFANKHYSRLKFLLMTLLVPLFVVPLVIMSTFAANGNIGMNAVFNMLWFYGGNGMASVLFMFFITVFEGIFNIADDFRLSELCNLSNPLLKRLASEAPGTFNHSLVVGILAEACALAIGENANLARCAAYYHDIGKLKAPLYFTENQSTYNPHDELIPEVSVSMITSHTLFGEILARQNKLPQEIVDICRQHHGTAPVGYFYRKALMLKEDGGLELDKYTYAGPKPQTKVAAIIMIADTIEAAIRAYMPDDKEEYEARINSLVDEKIKLKQFDECPITLGEIAIIKQTIMESLASMHHSRIEYDLKKRKKR